MPKHSGWKRDIAGGRLAAQYDGTEVFDFDANDMAITPALTTAAVTASGALRTSSTSPLGYTTGAGGVVTQATSITTGVTLNTPTGQITTVTNPSIAAAAEASFVVTNSAVAAIDVVVVSVQDQFTDGQVIAAVTKVDAGSFEVTLTNVSAAAVSAGTAVINFAVFKSAAS